MTNSHATAIILLSVLQQGLIRGFVAIDLPSAVDTPQAQGIRVPIFGER